MYYEVVKYIQDHEEYDTYQELFNLLDSFCYLHGLKKVVAEDILRIYSFLIDRGERR